MPIRREGGPPIDRVADVRPSASAWKPIQMALIRGTLLGASPSQRFVPGADDTPLEEQVDALIVYGPRSEASFSRLSPELCMDDPYIRMRAKRMGIADPADFIQRYCASVR